MTLTPVVLTDDLIAKWYADLEKIPESQVLELLNFDCAIGAIPTNDTKLNVFMTEDNRIVSKDHDYTISNPIGRLWEKDEIRDMIEQGINFTDNRIPAYARCYTHTRNDFVYRSTDYPEKLEGKEWADFRQGLNHLKREGVTVETFEGKLSDKLVAEIAMLIKGWRKTQDSIGYPPTGISKLCSQFDLRTFTTIFRYNGEIVHYFISEKLNNHYVVLLDGKMVNDDNTRRLFPNAAKAAHYMHIRHWSSDSYVTYFNMGFSEDGGGQFKRSLKPFLEQPHHYHTVSTKKAKKETSKPGIF
jgi:hypothetical protein